MLGRRQKRPDPAQISTVIGEDMHFDGNLRGSGSVRVDGRVTGEINVEGNVILGESATAEATISAESAKIAGRVQGDLECAEQVELTSSARVDGDIRCERLVVDRGAIFNGSSAMAEEPSQAGEVHVSTDYTEESEDVAEDQA